MDGTANIWTTYSHDLVDIKRREPAVCVEFCGQLLEAVAHVGRLFLLDVFVSSRKESGTSCLNRPELRELLRVFQDVFALAGAEWTAMLPSIANVSQAENLACLGTGGAVRDADLVCNLPLSALLLHALSTNDASVLSRHVHEPPPAPPAGTYLNVAATHDGIGLKWLRGCGWSLRKSRTRRSGRVELAGAHGDTSRRSRDAPWMKNADPLIFRGSAFFSWCRRVDSNHLPEDYEGVRWMRGSA